MKETKSLLEYINNIGRNRKILKSVETEFRVEK